MTAPTPKKQQTLAEEIAGGSKGPLALEVERLESEAKAKDAEIARMRKRHPDAKVDVGQEFSCMYRGQEVRCIVRGVVPMDPDEILVVYQFSAGVWTGDLEDAHQADFLRTFTRWSPDEPPAALWNDR